MGIACSPDSYIPSHYHPHWTLHFLARLLTTGPAQDIAQTRSRRSTNVPRGRKRGRRAVATAQRVNCTRKPRNIGPLTTLPRRLTIPASTQQRRADRRRARLPAPSLPSWLVMTTPHGLGAGSAQSPLPASAFEARYRGARIAAARATMGRKHAWSASRARASGRGMQGAGRCRTFPEISGNRHVPSRQHFFST